MKDDLVRNVVLGFGNRGVSLLGPMLDHDINNVVSAVVDPDISRSKFFLENLVKQGKIQREEADKIRFVTDLDELEKDEIDVLWLTASEKVRTEVFEKAVKTGAHIFMEKGLSNTLEGAGRIVKALEYQKAGQILFMGFNLRHFPAFAKAKKMLDAGAIGNILFLQYTEMMDYAHGGSFFMRFHRDVENSGGMLVTKACHDFDLISHLLNARPEKLFSVQHKRMFGKGGSGARERCQTCDRTKECDWDRMKTRKGRAAKRDYAKVYLDDDKVTTDGYQLDLCCWRDDTELRDLSHVMFEFDNGIPATYTQILFAPEGNRIIKVFGEDGSLEMEENSRSITIRDRWNKIRDTVSIAPSSGGHGGADQEIVAAFFQIIDGDEENASTIEDGVWALGTAFAAYKSNDVGEWVEVSPFVEKCGCLAGGIERTSNSECKNCNEK